MILLLVGVIQLRCCDHVVRSRCTKVFSWGNYDMQGFLYVSLLGSMRVFLCSFVVSWLPYIFTGRAWTVSWLFFLIFVLLWCFWWGFFFSEC